MRGSRPGWRRDLDRQLSQAFVAHHLAADQEGVAGGEGGREILLHLAERRPAVAVLEADLDQVGVDDGPEVHADDLRRTGVAQVPQAVRLLQPLPAVIGAQRIAAGRHEIEAGVELGPREGGVRPGGRHLGIERVGGEGRGTGEQQDVLAEHVAGPGAARLAIQRMLAHGVEGGAALDNLEAVGGDEQRLRRRVVAVVGATDALDEALDVLGRADLDHEIDVAPVDPEVERAGADDGTQLARDHRRLHPLTLFAGEAAVVDADGQRLRCSGARGCERRPRPARACCGRSAWCGVA